MELTKLGLFILTYLTLVSSSITPFTTFALDNGHLQQDRKSITSACDNRVHGRQKCDLTRRDGSTKTITVGSYDERADPSSTNTPGSAPDNGNDNANHNHVNHNNNTTVIFNRAAKNKKARREQVLAARRGSVNFAANCEGSVPSGRFAKPGTGLKMRHVLARGHDEAVLLASKARFVDPLSSSFRRYFDPESPENRHAKIVSKFFTVIAGEASAYNVLYDCNDEAVPECGDDDSNLMATDTTPSNGSPKKITVCQGFWSDSSPSGYFLPNSAAVVSNGPFRSRSDWCERTSDNLALYNVDRYTTVAHTILHELSHLDRVGLLSGFKYKSPEGIHGTLDFPPYDGALGAERLLLGYLQDEAGDFNMDPVDNAESFASFATDLFFKQYCQFVDMWNQL